jgi:hypothetical protein
MLTLYWSPVIGEFSGVFRCWREGETPDIGRSINLVTGLLARLVRRTDIILSWSLCSSVLLKLYIYGYL